MPSDDQTDATTPYLQETRRLSISTPLGTDALILTEIDGTEEISRLFAIQLRMISHVEAIKPQDIVGHLATITILDPDDNPR